MAEPKRVLSPEAKRRAKHLLDLNPPMPNPDYDFFTKQRWRWRDIDRAAAYFIGDKRR